MTNNGQPESNRQNRSGKIAAAIFLLLMIMPVCYAVLKEYRMAKQAKTMPAPLSKPSKQE
jgi:hypothetical protein